MQPNFQTANKPIASSKTLWFLFIFILMMPFSLQAQPATSGSEMFAFRLSPGQDLKTEIEKKVAENGWKAVAVVTCVGSLNMAHLRFANQSQGTEIPGKLEIVSLTGTVSPTGSHLHMSVSDSTGKTTGGHLLAGNPVYTTAEIILVILKDFEFERETDPTFGYKELKVIRKENPIKK
jgi:predicted DNA-binding protein with PD1-like motif